MPEFDPHDLAERQKESYRLVNTPSPGDTSIAVTNPDGTLIGSGGGSMTANQGTPAATANAWPIKVTDGVDTADVTAASALKVDGSAVTQPISGSVSVSNFPATTTVIQATGTNLHTVVDNFPATQPVSGTVTANQGTTPWIVDGSGVTQPISAAALPLPANAAQETGGNLASIATSTSNLDTTLTSRASEATAASILANQTNGTQVVTGSGDFTVVQPSGANLHVDVDNFPATQPISGTVTANQGTTPWVVDGSGVTQPVSGTVTADAGSGTFTVGQATGTNLHTVVDSGSITATQATGTNLHTVVDSGSITATQSGTWTVQPGNTQNTTNWLTQAYQQTDKIYNATTALTPKFAFANISASTTDGSIVSAVASKKIRVLALSSQTGDTATTITYNSKPGGAGSAISMNYQNGANGGEVLGYNPLGWFETASGEGLSATTGAGSTTGVQVVYVEV